MRKQTLKHPLEDNDWQKSILFNPIFSPKSAAGHFKQQTIFSIGEFIIKISLRNQNCLKINIKNEDTQQIYCSKIYNNSLASQIKFTFGTIVGLYDYVVDNKDNQNVKITNKGTLIVTYIYKGIKTYMKLMTETKIAESQDSSDERNGERQKKKHKKNYNTCHTKNSSTERKEVKQQKESQSSKIHSEGSDRQEKLEDQDDYEGQQKLENGREKIQYYEEKESEQIDWGKNVGQACLQQIDDKISKQSQQIQQINQKFTMMMDQVKEMSQILHNNEEFMKILCKNHAIKSQNKLKYPIKNKIQVINNQKQQKLSSWKNNNPKFNEFCRMNREVMRKKYQNFEKEELQEVMTNIWENLTQEERKKIVRENKIDVISNFQQNKNKNDKRKIIKKMNRNKSFLKINPVI